MEKIVEDDSRKLLWDALVNVPDKDKIDLLEAFEVVPELVDKESPFSRYIRAYPDPEDAARHVAMYWKNRTKLFGPIQALRPMTLHGAMEDVCNMTCLQKGDCHYPPQ